MIIRKARKEDFKEIHLLLIQLAPSNLNWHKGLKKPFLMNLKLPSSLNFVAVKNRQIIGFASGSSFFALWAKGDVFWVHELVVHYDHRRKGIGEILLGRLEKEALKKGAKELFVATQKNRRGAVKLYKKCGFIPSDNFHLRKFFKK